MKLGFAFESRWLKNKDGYYVKVRELYYALQKKHQLVVTECPFPGANIGYSKRSDFFNFTKDIDALIIVVSNLYTNKFTLSNLFKSKKIPIIWILESPVEEALSLPWSKKQNIFLDKMLLKIFAKHVDLCLCVSKEIQKYAINDLGIESTVVLPNASNPQLFKKNQTNNNPISKMRDNYTVMWAGAGQYPWQGLDLLYAVAKKMKHHSDITFVVISSHSWSQVPKDLNNLLVLNSVDYEQMPNYLNAADVLLCFYKDNFRGNLYNSPMKLFDYMAMEKPIIASDLGQIKEIVADGKNGLLTNNTVADVCKKILLLKNNPQFAKKLAANARKEIVKNYNWDQVVRKIETHLQLILDVHKI